MKTLHFVVQECRNEYARKGNSPAWLGAGVCGWAVNCTAVRCVVNILFVGVKAKQGLSTSDQS